MVTTPNVEYVYDQSTMDGDLVKGARLKAMIYPNGRVLRYEYACGADDNLGRVSFLADDDQGEIGTHLAAYTRLGVGTFVRVDYPEPQLRCDLAHGAGANPYIGFDRLGRVIDFVWRNLATGQDVERIRHGYDRAGNRLWRACPVAAALGKDVDELYRYDGLHQLTRMERGQLTGDKKAVAVRTFAEAWRLDSTGNWERFQQDDRGDGRWDLDQTRTHSRRLANRPPPGRRPGPSHRARRSLRRPQLPLGLRRSDAVPGSIAPRKSPRRRRKNGSGRPELESVPIPILLSILDQTPPGAKHD